MKRCLKCLALALLFVLAFPFNSPAPLVYRPGIGWVYEPVGGESSWVRTKAVDQLKVAQEAFDRKDYGTTEKAARWLLRNWPLSDHAPQAEYLLARSNEETRHDEAAFNSYQALLNKYPKAANYEEVLQRQFEICNRFLNGQRFKIFGIIPGLSSMEKTIKMYEQLIKNGPYSSVAPLAQLNIGTAREKQTRFFNDDEPYVLAAHAYHLAVDRYHDRPGVAADALFREGCAYEKQARTAEYDQATATKAIDIFREFKEAYPNDPRVKEADDYILTLKNEQARGNFETAKYYEKLGAWAGAKIYYNEVVQKNQESPYKDIALQRIAELNKRTEKKE